LDIPVLGGSSGMVPLKKMLYILQLGTVRSFVTSSDGTTKLFG